MTVLAPQPSGRARRRWSIRRCFYLSLCYKKYKINPKSARSGYHTQLAKKGFDKIFDTTAGWSVFSFNFFAKKKMFAIWFTLRLVGRFPLLGWRKKSGEILAGAHFCPKSLFFTPFQRYGSAARFYCYAAPSFAVRSQTNMCQFCRRSETFWGFSRFDFVLDARFEYIYAYTIQRNGLRPPSQSHWRGTNLAHVSWCGATPRIPARGARRAGRLFHGLTSTL